MQRDSTRTKVWFPLFSYFESSVEGIVPNEYETPNEILCNLCTFFRTHYYAVRRFFVNNIAKNNNNKQPDGNYTNITNSVLSRVSKSVLDEKLKSS